MLCEVIAYILSRQRLSAKTFVAGYFFMLCRIDCLCGCCATPPVSEKLSASPSHGFALRALPAVTHSVSPPETVSAGWEISFFSPSPLLHSPRVHPSGITRGYAWCVPSGDSGCACEDVHLQSSFTEFIKSLYIVCGTAFFLPRGCLNVSKNVGCGCRKGGAARVNTVFI